MLTPSWHGFNVLHTAAARVGALDLGFLPGPGGKDLARMMGGGVDVLWLLGADEFDTGAHRRRTHSSSIRAITATAAPRAPTSSCPAPPTPRRDGTYVNTEGRVQRGFLAVYPPGEAREDWKIMRAVSELSGHTLPYDDTRRRCARGWSR